MPSAIVTGGSGFLGHHLVRALQHEGYTVKNIDLKPNSECETVIADIRDKDAMLREIKNADVVYHLAALIEAGESVKEPQAFIDANITGSLNVLEAMRVNGVPLIMFSSSAAVYGEPLRTPILEDDRTMPINPYGMTKLAMEALVSSYTAAHGITGVALRYFNLYGPEEHHNPETHAIPRFISQIAAGQPITVWGKGEHVRDFIYISDVVSAHVSAIPFAQANPHQYHYFNLSAEKGTSVREVIDLIAAAMAELGIEHPPLNIQENPPRPGDPLVLTADASKAKTTLGWSAQVDIHTGVKNTVEYFLKQKPT
jgi:nucleoside-diphosphate-sugar epimerase